MPSLVRSGALLLGALTALAPLSIDMYLPTLPSLQQDLQATEAAVQLTLAAFFLAFALGQLVWGPLSDRYGRKPPLQVALGIFLLASLACTWAPTVESLTVARFFQALGACAGAVIARAIVRDRYDGLEAARLLATMMLVMGVAPLLAPLLGAILLDVGWRWVFATLAVMGGVLLFSVRSQLPESHALTARHRYSLTQVLRSYQRLLGTRHFLVLAFVGSCLLTSLYAYIAGAAFIYIVGFQVTPTQFALLFGLNAFWFIAGTQLNSRLLAHRSATWILSRALAAQSAAGLLLISLSLLGDPSLLAFVLSLGLFTSCMGFISPNVVVLVMSPYPEQAGTVSALYGTCQSLMGAMGAVLVAILPESTAALAAVMVSATWLSAGVWWFASNRQGVET